MVMHNIFTVPVYPAHFFRRSDGKNDDDIKQYWKKAYEFADEIKNWPQWKKEIRIQKL